MQFDYTVFIGRFAPVHFGHLAVIERALEVSDRVIIFVGSSNRSRSIRNPFTFAERNTMLMRAIAYELGGDKLSRVIVREAPDFMYNDFAWNENIVRIVTSIAGEKARIALVGHSKDHTSYYLREFPMWDSVDVPNFDNLSSTTMRNNLLGFRYISDVTTPAPIISYLEDWLSSSAGQKMITEWEQVKLYQKAWESAPYPPTFNTVDAVVAQGGHVLLVVRKESPGQGLFALPGGFLNQNETLLDGALRELDEETKIKVPPAVLRGCVTKRKTYDDPYRSVRGRTITHAVLVDLNKSNDIKLPRVKGSDDAVKAFWAPVATLDPTQMFEDHYFIIRDMLEIG